MVKLTTRQIAELYAVNMDKVVGWIRSGQLAAIDVSQRAGGRPRYRVDAADLAEFEESRRVRTAPVPTQRRSRRRQSGPIEYF
jgi:helix-turn-helix protein